MASEAEDWKSDWRVMEDACHRVLAYTRDYDAEAFRRDPRTFDAVLRNLELISHAADGIPVELRHQVPADRWRGVARFAELVADSVTRDNHAAVWSALQSEIPELAEALQAADFERQRLDEDPAERRRGRAAHHPGQIPLRGWRDIAWRVWCQIEAHNDFLVAAGVAFYGLFSVFPALVMLVSLYGLMFDVSDVRQQLEALARLLPSEAWGVIEVQLTRVAANPSITLSISALVSLVLTLWSARAGIGGLMLAMNIVYDETEKRSLVSWYAWSLLLTIAAIVYTVLALASIVALPALMAALGFERYTQGWVNLLRWPLLALSTMVGLAVIYRYGPSRRYARWSWVSWGAVLATVLWLAGSLLFSYYISHFADYDRTYGSVGAVIVLMLWFFVSAFIVLLGAELDAETEHQTRMDSTVGPPRPMGERGAHVADTVGRTP
ncbi:MAG: YhjD/YihY/BrkB family envelope integrity protein [Pseudomonadota bacterium]